MVTKSRIVEAEKTNELVRTLVDLLNSEKIRFNEKLPDKFAGEAGVYRVVKHGKGWQESIYVGQSGNLKRRLKEILSGKRESHVLNGKLKDNGIPEPVTYLKRNCYVQVAVIEEVGKGTRRKLLEHLALAILSPEYNG